VFRNRVRYNETIKSQLAEARRSKDPLWAITAVHDRLRPVDAQEAGVVVDLLLSYRSISAFDCMISLVAEMSPPIAASVLVREQLALALNREGKGDEAEAVLLAIVDKAGPSSETFGLLGRVFKDRWKEAESAGSLAAPALLRKAIDAYRRGYQADLRDPYPGINLLTLLEIQSPGQPAVDELLPVVSYAARVRAGSAQADYWDRATLLELAVIGRDRAERDLRLEDSLAERPESWMKKSTVGNLDLIARAREASGEDESELRSVIAKLQAP
jgi:MAP3K TRAFs-binding domain